jgi:hypothetical protein
MGKDFPHVRPAIILHDLVKEGNCMSALTGAIRSSLLASGITVTKCTKSEDILQLMRKLRPLDCGMELIRIGNQGDGGYLIPNDLEGIEYCFSPGVGPTCEFENQLADRGIRSFLADYSVDGPPAGRPEFVFDKKFLGCRDDDVFITLPSWKSAHLPDYSGDLLLQMDIEGAEYEVIPNAPAGLLRQYRIMAIEFHYMQRLFDPFVFPLIAHCFEKILQDFYVAHIHPNNGSPSVKSGDVDIPHLLEFTFINKRRVKMATPRRHFPHPLDVNNGPGKPLPLPKCWYAQS